MQIECSLCECQIVKRSREITKKDVVFRQITTGSIHLEALSVMSQVELQTNLLQSQDTYLSKVTQPWAPLTSS